MINIQQFVGVPWSACQNNFYTCTLPFRLPFYGMESGKELDQYPAQTGLYYPGFSLAMDLTGDHKSQSQIPPVASKVIFTPPFFGGTN